MIQADYWGYYDYEGISFYIEPDSVLDKLCPFKKPDKKIPCPHSGLCESNRVNWKKKLFVPDETLTINKLEKLIPKGLQVRQSLTFCHAAYLPPKPRLIQLLSCTNALPLMIYGLDLNMNYDRVFQIGRASMLRPVYISGDPDIPVPSDYKGEEND